MNTFCKLFFSNHAGEEHRSDSRKILFKRMTFFLLSLRSALECVISGKFLKSWECMTFLLSLLRSALECVIWGKFLKSWECAGSAWFLQLSLRSALGVRDFRKMLEVLGVRWKCVAHFCYGGGSALGVRESALEFVTNDRSAWKVRTPTHFCSVREGCLLWWFCRKLTAFIMAAHCICAMRVLFSRPCWPSSAVCGVVAGSVFLPHHLTAGWESSYTSVGHTCPQEELDHCIRWVARCDVCEPQYVSHALNKHGHL